MKKKTVVLFLLLFAAIFPLQSFGQEKRDLLQDNYSRKFLAESIQRDHKWMDYPEYSDRESWGQLTENQRRNTIKEVENYLGFDWPIVKATMYLEFTRTGDWTKDAKVNSARRKALQSLVLAELMEGEGRFMDDIINGVIAFCEQTYWGASAHFYLYGFDGTIAQPTTVLPDIDDPIIDLVVGDVASDLAWTYHFFKDEFDRVSPVIAKRLKEGKLFDYLDLLHKNTDGAIDLFDRELIKNMGRYIYRAYISNGEHYINFADSPFKIMHNPGRIYRYGQRINDETMMAFGAFEISQKL